MDADKQKFEQARDKFRQSMRREQEKRPRTIFLSDDDIPGTSHQSRRNPETTKRRGKWRKREERPPKPEKPSSYRNTTKITHTAQYFKMATTTQPTYQAGQLEIITIDDEEGDTPPPPPPTVNSTTPPGVTIAENATEDEARDGTPVWVRAEDECVSLSDLVIDPEDLSDPLINEFYRTFLGTSDTTVDIRPPTPASPFPPSSPSSIDWENENYRPPTPPRPRRYGSLEIEDRQFPYLGMHCYERVWRARILVPRQSSGLALHELLPSSSPAMQSEVPMMPESPQQPYRPSNITSPPTPGRGWLYTDPPSSTSPAPHLKNQSYSPPAENTASPPLGVAHCPNSILTPLPTTTTPETSKPEIDDPRFAQLPAELQKFILEKKEENRGKRYRTVKAAGDSVYRITIKPNNTVQITFVKKE